MKKLILLLTIVGCQTPTEPKDQITCIKKEVPMPKGTSAVVYTSPIRGVACRIP